jgi:hypothetical protein
MRSRRRMEKRLLPGGMKYVRRSVFPGLTVREGSTENPSLVMTLVE